MTMKTALKLTALAGLLAWAVPGRAEPKYYELRPDASSATLRVGYQGITPADAVLTSSGAFVVQSTSNTSGYKPLTVKNNAHSEILSVMQDGTLTVTGPTLTHTGSVFTVAGTTLATSGGNVGVGTASPATRLQVSTPDMEIARFGGSSTSAQYVRILNSLGQLILGQEGNASGVSFTNSLSSASVLLSNSNTPLQLGVNSAIDVTVSTGGKVGIGTNNPFTLLDVNGVSRSKGVTDGSDATAGYVGEFISTAPTGDITPAATGVTISIATTTLTAGDWDVDGSAFFAFGSGLTATLAIVAISLTPNAADAGIYRAEVLPPSDNFTARPLVRRVSVTTPTAVYLTAKLQYTVNTGGVWNAANTQMRARRVR